MPEVMEGVGRGHKGELCREGAQEQRVWRGSAGEGGGGQGRRPREGEGSWALLRAQPAEQGPGIRSDCQIRYVPGGRRGRARGAAPTRSRRARTERCALQCCLLAPLILHCGGPPAAAVREQAPPPASA